MADNARVNPNTGANATYDFRMDDVGGVLVPYSKIDVGEDGASAPWVGTTTVPFNAVAAPPVRLVGQDVWTCSFASVGAGLLTSDFITPITGTGVSASQAAGALAIVTGTSTNAEFLTRTTLSWRGSLRMRASIVASQRIANQNLAIMLADLVGQGLTYTINSATSVTVTVPGHTYTAQNVGQFINLAGITGAAGVPGRYAIASVVASTSITFTVAGWPASGTGTLTLFGWNFVRNLVTGATATNINFTTQRRGWADADTVPTTITTASPGVIVQNDLTGRDAFFSNSLRASVTAGNFASLASRYENLPDDDVPRYVWIWSFNGTVAPASTTTWTIGFISVEKFANTPVYLQGVRAQGTQNALPVSQQGTVTATIGSITTLSPAINADTATNLAVGATFTGTSRDQGATAVNQRVAATFVADQASAADGARIEFSTDNTNWRRAAQATLVANVPVQLSVFLATRYWRVVLVNGGVAQTQVLVTSGMYRI